MVHNTFRILALVLFSVCCFAQLPDAPSQVKINHCYQGMLDLNDQITYREIDCSTVPQWKTITPDPVIHKPGFFTVRRPDEPKLRTTKQVLLSPSFIIEETLMWGATFYNVEATRNQKQNPPIPRHSELYIDAYVPLIPISVFHFLARKYICQCVGDIPVVYTTAWHGYNAVKGYYP